MDVKNKRKKGQILVISGPSGSGKGTTVAELMRLYPEEYALSVSCTTRKPREGEIPGVHYHFITAKDFEKRVKEDRFLEHACYNGRNSYGTPREPVEKWLEEGKNVILEIDVQGGLQVKKKVKEAILIMVSPPSRASLEKRLRGRGTEKEEEILSRLDRAAEELDKLPLYDYLVLLPDNEITLSAQRIHDIVNSEACRAEKHLDFVKAFYEE